MAKQTIPQAFIDDILARTNLAELVSSRLSMKRSGSNWHGCCPFHQEKTASFSVSEQKQFFYCFGCKASGNAVKFMMDYHNFSFPEAIEQLAGELGMPMPELEHSSPNQSQSCYSLLDRVTDFYTKILQQTPQALDYLEGRGLSQTTIKQFRIGYAPPEWDTIKKQFGKQVQQHQDLVRTGMLIEKNQRTYDRFRGRIMFPIINPQGKIIAFGGRVTNQETPKYLNSPETDIFHKNNELFGLYQARQAQTKLDQLVVVEGYMDVIALASQGITYAVACLGTAITHGHIKKLLKQANKIIFCFDGDRAGQAAAWKALTTSLPHAHDGVTISFCSMPEGEDPDTYIKHHSVEKFTQLLKQSAPLSNFFFEHLQDEYGNTSLDQKAALGKAAKQLIETMPEGIFKALLHQELEKTIDLASSPQIDPPQSPEPTSTNQNISPIRLAITHLVHKPDLLKDTQLPGLDSNNKGEAMLSAVIDLIHKHPHITNTAQLLEYAKNKPWYDIIHHLACQELPLSSQATTEQFHGYLQKHWAGKTQSTINHLIEKSSRQRLSAEEKKQLQKLILEQKS